MNKTIKNMASTVTETLSDFITASNCESCDRELQFKYSKKECSSCHGVFCQRCVQVAGSPINTCAKCRIFNSKLVQRHQLERLSSSELRYYYNYHNITLPSDRIEQLIEGILLHQAQIISERAIDAQLMLSHPSLLGDLNFVTRNDKEPKMTTPTSAPHSVSSTTATAAKTTVIRDDFIPGAVTNITDLQYEHEIDLLPVKILKIILQRNCMDYRGCVEKEELREKVKRLWKAHEKAKVVEDKIAGDIDAENEFLCKICMDEPVDCVLLECGHMLSCVKCGRQLNECPVCRQYVVRVVHAFKM